MKIYLNSIALDVMDSTTLHDVVAAQGFPEFGIAVAVNNKVVPKTKWAERQLEENDRITVIRAVCGG